MLKESPDNKSSKRTLKLDDYARHNPDNNYKPPIFIQESFYLDRSDENYIKVRSILDKLLKVSGIEKESVKLDILFDKEEEAFIYSKIGHIFLSYGLLEKNPTEDIIAGILAHELTHYKYRNYKNKEDSTFKNKVLKIEEERTADLEALDMVNLAGYNPNGMLEYFKSKKPSNYNFKDLHHLISTPHESNPRRVEYLQEALRGKLYKNRNNPFIKFELKELSPLSKQSKQSADKRKFKNIEDLTDEVSDALDNDFEKYINSIENPFKLITIYKKTDFLEKAEKDILLERLYIVLSQKGLDKDFINSYLLEKKYQKDLTTDHFYNILKSLNDLKDEDFAIYDMGDLKLELFFLRLSQVKENITKEKSNKSKSSQKSGEEFIDLLKQSIDNKYLDDEEIVIIIEKLDEIYGEDFLNIVVEKITNGEIIFKKSVLTSLILFIAPLLEISQIFDILGKCFKKPLSIDLYNKVIDLLNENFSKYFKKNPTYILNILDLLHLEDRVKLLSDNQDIFTFDKKQLDFKSFAWEKEITIKDDSHKVVNKYGNYISEIDSELVYYSYVFYNYKHIPENCSVDVILRIIITKDSGSKSLKLFEGKSYYKELSDKLALHNIYNSINKENILQKIDLIPKISERNILISDIIESITDKDEKLEYFTKLKPYIILENKQDIKNDLEKSLDNGKLIDDLGNVIDNKNSSISEFMKSSIIGKANYFADELCFTLWENYKTKTGFEEKSFEEKIIIITSFFPENGYRKEQTLTDLVKNGSKEQLINILDILKLPNYLYIIGDKLYNILEKDCKNTKEKLEKILFCFKKPSFYRDGVIEKMLLENTSDLELISEIKEKYLLRGNTVKIADDEDVFGVMFMRFFGHIVYYLDDDTKFKLYKKMTDFSKDNKDFFEFLDLSDKKELFKSFFSGDYNLCKSKDFKRDLSTQKLSKSLGESDREIFERGMIIDDFLYSIYKKIKHIDDKLEIEVYNPVNESNYSYNGVLKLNFNLSESESEDEKNLIKDEKKLKKLIKKLSSKELNEVINIDSIKKFDIEYLLSNPVDKYFKFPQEIDILIKILSKSLVTLYENDDNLINSDEYYSDLIYLLEKGKNNSIFIKFHIYKIFLEVYLEKYKQENIEIFKNIGRTEDTFFTVLSTLEPQKQTQVMTDFFSNIFGNEDIEPSDYPIIFLEAVGTIFIKMGQKLASMGILPKDLEIKFEKLTSRVDPISVIDFWDSLHQELGDDISKISELGTLLNVASVRQVMNGKYNGNNSAIKLKKPSGVNELEELNNSFEKAVKILNAMPHLLGFEIPQNLVREMIDKTANEITSSGDVTNQRKFGEKYGGKKIGSRFGIGGKTIKVPEVIYNTDNVTIESIAPGDTLDKYEFKESSGELEKDLLDFFITSILESGDDEDFYYHGDPHKGNILVSKKHISILDFGMVGKLESQEKVIFLDLLKVLKSQNKQDVIVFLMSLHKYCKGDFKDISLFILNKDLDIFIKKHNGNNINVKNMIRDFLSIVNSNSIKIPKNIETLINTIFTMGYLFEGNEKVLIEIGVREAIKSIFSKNGEDILLKTKKSALEYIKESNENGYKMTLKKGTLVVDEERKSNYYFLSQDAEIFIDDSNNPIMIPVSIVPYKGNNSYDNLREVEKPGSESVGVIKGKDRYKIRIGGDLVSLSKLLRGE